MPVVCHAMEQTNQLFSMNRARQSCAQNNSKQSLLVGANCPGVKECTGQQGHISLCTDLPVGKCAIAHGFYIGDFCV